MRASDTDGDSSGAEWSRSDVNRLTALGEAARASRTTSTGRLGRDLARTLPTPASPHRRTPHLAAKPPPGGISLIPSSTPHPPPTTSAIELDARAAAELLVDAGATGRAHPTGNPQDGRVSTSRPTTPGRPATARAARLLPGAGPLTGSACRQEEVARPPGQKARLKWWPGRARGARCLGRVGAAYWLGPLESPLLAYRLCHNATRVHATGTGRRLGGQDCRRVEPCRPCHPSVRSRRGPYVNSEARPGRRPQNGPCAAAAQATGSPSGRTARRSTRSLPDQKDVPPEFGRDSLGLRAALPVTSPRWSSATWCSCR